MSELLCDESALVLLEFNKGLYNVADQVLQLIVEGTLVQIEH